MNNKQIVGCTAWQYNYSQPIANDELYHYGILGMKWGRRKDKTSYRSTGISSAIARKKNEQVDKSFKNWKENSNKKANAIDLGKKANSARRAYENNKSDKNLKNEYKQSAKEYKKALRENTTYRKGDIKREVGQDSARKYLSDAKKVKKQLNVEPSNKDLQKQYNHLMSKHDVERANARRAPEIAANRSRKKAAIKRTMTMTAKTAATSAAVVGGMYAVNKYLEKNNVKVNGQDFRVSPDSAKKVANAMKVGKDAMKAFRRYV